MINFDLTLPENLVTTAVYGLQASTGSTYLITLESSDLVNQPVSFIVTDTSSSPDRYQQFVVITSGVTLALGDYSYQIFEDPDSVLDPTGLNLLEIGRWVVTGPATQSIPAPYQNPTVAEFGSYKNPYYSNNKT